MTRKFGAASSVILLVLAALLLIRTLAASSTDPILWFEQDSGTLADLFAVTWGGGQYVAVGENGKIATSPDGVTWTNRFSGTSDSLVGVAWNGSLYVAAGGDTIISSSDGVTWTFRSDAGGGSLKSLAWGGGLFIAVGGRYFGGGAGLTMISPDGITWASYNEPNSTPLAIDWAGSHFYRMHEDYLYRSSDGLAWELVLNRSDSDFRGVCLGSSAFVAVGDGVTCLSPDGSGWTCTPASTNAQRDVVFSGENFITGGGNVYLSSDGLSWTHSLNGLFYGLAMTGGQVVAVGYSGHIFLGFTDIIFYDGFEWGRTNAWSVVVPPPTPTPVPSDTPTPLPTDTPTQTPTPTDTPTPPPPTDTPTPTWTPGGPTATPTNTPTPVPLECSDLRLTHALQRGNDSGVDATRINMDVGNYTPYRGYLVQTTILWSETQSQAGGPYINRLRFEGRCNNEYWHDNIYIDPAIIDPPYQDPSPPGGNSDCLDENVSFNPGDTRADWDAYLEANHFWIGEVCAQLDFYFPDDPEGKTCYVNDCINLNSVPPTFTPINTSTPIGPTATPTFTPTGPTATPTNTPTPSYTPTGPTATPTNTPTPPYTPTSFWPVQTDTPTPIPPTATPIPPTPTNTPREIE